MRMNLKKVCGLGMLVLTGMVSAAAMMGAPATVYAGQRTLESDHHSVLKIANDASFPIHRLVRLGRNKSMMVELPREIRDVVVSDPKQVDAVVQSSSRVFLIGKAFSGNANVFFFDSNGERMMTLEVSIETDVSALEALYKRLLPGSNVKVEILRDTLILTGSVQSPADATRAQQIAQRFQLQPDTAADSNAVAPMKVINMLAVAGKEQVQLRVTVSEVNRSLLKQFGINMGAVISSGNFGIGLLTENALPLTAAAGLGKLPIPGINLGDGNGGCAAGGLCSFNAGPAANTFGNSGANAGWASNGHRINGAVRMMERAGLLRTLAEPNLTSISGETAKFLAGGEFPVPMSDGLGNITVMFKKFGVGLAFTPVVSAEDRITLKIDTEVSELSTQGAVTVGALSIPALKTRQANTTVELPSGGALAIAGLLSDDTRQNLDGVPGLKDLPVLGTLFRSRDYIKNETELVVIVQPLIVKHVARNNLAQPTNNLAPASDQKANLLGHLNRIYGKAPGSQPRGRYEGDYGFIVE